MHAGEVYEQVARLGVLGALRPARRLERLLIELVRAGYEPWGEGFVRLTTVLKRHEVGQAIGVSREHASRLLAHLEASKAIRRQKGWLLIPATSTLLQGHWAENGCDLKHKQM
jgi:CRP-like cAMP-binding protein